MTDLRSPLPPTPPPTLPRSTADLFGDPVDVYPPWLNPTAFVGPEFDPESYISDLRAFVPLETLRSELQSHLSSLQKELVDLINRDYSDFVSLSTKLIDIDACVVRMRAPLLDIKEKILAFRDAVDASLVALKSRLKQRADANQTREVLELLLDTFHVVSKVEKLIKELPDVPVDLANGYVNSGAKDNGFSLQNVENGTSLRETQSMLLERIASEMNRLKFYIAHAQNMPFIENMEKRVQGASLLVDTSLGHCFIDALEHRDANAIYNCLRAFAALDNIKNAEEIFRSTVVMPFMEKIFPAGGDGKSTDELEQDYQRIKQFINDDCKFLLEISAAENSGLHVFSFIANSILKEVLSAIQKGKPGAFSPGRPTVFLKNYKSSLDFLAHLEGYYHTRSAVAKFRSEAVYAEFMKQWNIGVYFSLRFQEIAGTLDESLRAASLAPVQDLSSDSSNFQSLVLKQSVSLLDCLRACWRDDVLVISFADKFLRLTLQLLSRFSNWLSTGLAARRSSNVGSNPGTEWAISAVPEDLIYVIYDLHLLADEVSDDYLGHVTELLQSCPTEVLDLVKQSILHAGKSLQDLLPLVMNSIIDTLVEKSVKDLMQLKGITATYRMTNKPLPVRHSQYVSGVLRPIKVILCFYPWALS
ncbi:OLC1v1008418C2 [Oldenlandia corymbosa var. corymbosa]|uniref:Conserved oligomeric Golgi complex subunit 2 n=1 Tax=Oldenlandia corymbosa var. corymbosa TaxID=529605 RepID=A0AAV1DLQ4_OLDCO|nr:OLC1v1008418C2 [Oldenlandia corymbosa var. corymbosa]